MNIWFAECADREVWFSAESATEARARAKQFLGRKPTGLYIANVHADGTRVVPRGAENFAK